MKEYKYYIGMDAHKDNCYLVVLNRKGRILLRRKMSTGEGELVQFFKRVKGTKALVFEETNLAQWLFVTLKNSVEHIVVCQATQKTAKSDYRDAIEMADLLRVGRLKTVFHGETKYMLLRDLVHGYESLVQDMTRMKNRLSHLYNRAAIRKKGLCIYTKQEAIKILPDTNKRFVATGLFEQIQLLTKQKQQYLKQFGVNIKSFKEMGLILGIPGFGKVRTNQVVAHTITPQRFANKYKYFSYSMLTRHYQISDGVVYGKKNPHAKSQLKNVFKSAALDALKSDNAFRRKYDEMIINGTDERCARNSVTRSLAATVLGVWKSGKPYKDNYWEKRREKNEIDEI